MAQLGRPRINDGAVYPSHVSRQVRWQMRQRAIGQCINCKRPAVTATKCERHRRPRVRQDYSHEAFTNWIEAKRSDT